MFTQNVLFSKRVRYGVPVASRGVTQAFAHAAAESGLPTLHLHGRRHS